MGARKAFWMQEDEARGEDEEHFSYYAFDGRTVSSQFLGFFLFHPAVAAVAVVEHLSVMVS